MTLKRLIRTHLCPLFLAVAMMPLAACGASMRDDVEAAPPPPGPQMAALPPEPVEPPPPPVPPPKPDRYYEGTVTKVGILLPLSGPNASLGEAMLSAAQLALFDVGDPSIVLVPRDTEGRDGAAGAAQDAIDDGARVLLGPIFADAIRSAGPVARQFQVPLIGFSTDHTVAGNGIYIMGFTPQQQVDRIVKYAIDQGDTRLAALVPQSAYGTMVLEAMRNAAGRYGGTLVTAETFQQNQAGLADPVERLSRHRRQVAAPPPEAEVLAPGAPDMPQTEPRPVYEYDFDAVLIAAGGSLLKTLAPMLPYYDIEPEQVQFLGTGLWDDDTLASEPALAGAWYAGPSPDVGASFTRRFRSVYGDAPPRVATIAYDAVSLVAALKKMRPERPFTRQALTDPQGFTGIDGVFRFGPDGVAERGLAVVSLGREGARVIDMPPEKFGTSYAQP
jgi:ABC-type branched-subunit amino acid transport system substrate-binding protein